MRAALVGLFGPASGIAKIAHSLRGLASGAAQCSRGVGQRGIGDTALDDGPKVFRQALDLVGAVVDSPFGDLKEGILHEGAVELRLAELAVGERNRHLAQVEALLNGAEGDIDLEDVAGLRQLVERERLQHLAAEGAVAGGHV